MLLSLYRSCKYHDNSRYLKVINLHLYGQDVCYEYYEFAIMQS